MRGRGGAAEEIGKALLAQAHPRFTWWPQGRAGTLQARDVSLLQDAVAPRGGAGMGSGPAL
jgi:hypothetical protein